MRKPAGYLTASGFLSAILLVWAQLWFGSRTAGAQDWASSLGLAWTFTAVLLSLTGSISVFIYGIQKRINRSNTYVPTWTLWLLLVSMGMAIITVTQSIASNIVFLVTKKASLPAFLADILHLCVEQTKPYFWGAGVGFFLLIVLIVSLIVHSSSRIKF